MGGMGNSTGVTGIKLRTREILVNSFLVARFVFCCFIE